MFTILKHFPSLRTYPKDFSIGGTLRKSCFSPPPPTPPFPYTHTYTLNIPSDALHSRDSTSTTTTTTSSSCSSSSSSSSSSITCRHRCYSFYKYKSDLSLFCKVFPLSLTHTHAYKNEVDLSERDLCVVNNRLQTYGINLNSLKALRLLGLKNVFFFILTITILAPEVATIVE